MRLGIVSDIHCNIAALELAIARMGDVDELLCAGDAFYEYRFSNEVIALLQSTGARYVLGNHEAVLLDHRGVRAREAPAVDQTKVAWVAEQPLSIEVDVGGGKKLLMTHASPLEPGTQYVWPKSPELARLAEVEADYVILGHTHTQMAERVGRALVINPGSTGEARDHSNGRRLSYAVLDTVTGEVLIDNFSVGDPPVPELVAVNK
jgi:putative phosphoesterase